MKKNIFLRFALMGLLALFLLAAAPAAVFSSPNDVDVNARVEEAVKNYPAVSVMTADGVVMVSGAVKTQQEKKDLIDRILRVDGVKDVTDKLTIQNVK